MKKLLTFITLLLSSVILSFTFAQSEFDSLFNELGVSSNSQEASAVDVQAKYNLLKQVLGFL
jgi:hypothetical protein